MPVITDAGLPGYAPAFDEDAEVDAGKMVLGAPDEMMNQAAGTAMGDRQTNYLRELALQLAHNSQPHKPPEDIVARAKAYLEFLEGK